MSKYHYADYKTILSPSNGMNLYRGCTHGCIYCDSRSECYRRQPARFMNEVKGSYRRQAARFMNEVKGSYRHQPNEKHDFEDIEVKRDAVKILEQQLKRKRKPCMLGTGSMCDPYIPLEKELQVTRAALELVLRYGFGVTLITKSALVLRDLELLKAINAKTKCVVQMTLTTYDEELCKKIEPAVSTTAERFAVLETLRDNGIPMVVWLCPILPFINDTEENLRGILEYCIRAGVRGILCFGFGVTLRSGDREYFYEQLDKHFAGMKQKYIRTFGNNYVCNSPNNDRLMKIFTETCKAHGILYKPDDVFKYLKTFEKKEKQLSMFN